MVLIVHTAELAKLRRIWTLIAMFHLHQTSFPVYLFFKVALVAIVTICNVCYFLSSHTGNPINTKWYLMC